MTDRDVFLCDNTNMTGGKLISEGGYGCLYYPEINCKGKQTNNKKYISKIQRYDTTAKNEIFLGSIIKKLKFYKNYFAPTISHCKKVNISDISSMFKKDCAIFEKKKSNNNFITLQFDYIPGDTFINYMINNKNSKLLMLNIIQTYRLLQSSIDILFKQTNIVHYDLKGENIMFNTRTNKPIIIDFGLSILLKNITKANLKNHFYIYAPDYYIWSPEIHYLCYILHVNDTPTKEEIKNIVNDIVSDNSSLNYIYSDRFLHKYKEGVTRYLLQFKGKTPYEVFKLLKPYANTWDNFSISMMYFKILHYLNLKGFTNNKFIIFFTQVLLQNAHPNPQKRMNPEHTTELFNSFFYKTDEDTSKDYLQLLTHFDNYKLEISKKIIKDEKILQKIIKK